MYTEAEILSAKEALTKAKENLNKATVEMRRIFELVEHIVYECRDITDRPNRYDSIARNHTRLDGETFKVFTQRYVGEGNYEINTGPIKVPIRFLSMPLSEVKAAVQKDHDRVLAENKAREEKREAKKAAEEEEARRQTFLALKAEFEGAEK
jgi:hypothetical protein